MLPMRTLPGMSMRHSPITHGAMEIASECACGYTKGGSPVVRHMLVIWRKKDSLWRMGHRKRATVGARTLTIKP